GHDVPVRWSRTGDERKGIEVIVQNLRKNKTLPHPLKVIVRAGVEGRVNITIPLIYRSRFRNGAKLRVLRPLAWSTVRQRPGHPNGDDEGGCKRGKLHNLLLSDNRSKKNPVPRS